MWDLSCVDWADRMREGRSLIPDLPLFEDEASMGLQFYDELRLPDVPGNPKLGTASGQWFRDIVRASFGSWDPVSQVRHIRDIFVMAPKGSSKTSYSAGLMLAVMMMNKRPRAEALFVGPTQAISDRAYDQAAGMIEEDRDLQKRFATHDHVKTIECRVTRSEMKVKTFDLKILTGSILIFVLLDELHLLGKSPHTTKVLRQIRGGLDKTPEGQFLITTTRATISRRAPSRASCATPARSATASTATRSGARCCRSCASFRRRSPNSRGTASKSRCGTIRPTGPTCCRTSASRNTSTA
jgi:phage terminase large subunit-like protein